MKQLSDCTVLIVDDEEVNLDILSKTLQPHFKVETASNGPDALKMVKTTPVDIILLDIMMPGVDGHDVCRELKASPATKDIPIIFITALTDDHNEAQGFELGAVDYITKPFWPQVVLSRVETHLKLKLSQMELKELFEQTLLGSVRVVSDILSLTNSTAFRQTHSIRRLAKAIATDMGCKNLWKYDLAARFAHLGCITIPGDELHNICVQKGEASSESRALFDDHPQRAAELIGNIPRLEEVAAMVAGQRTVHDPESDDPMHTPCQILRTAIDFNSMILKGMTEADAISVLRGSVTPYDPQIVASLEKGLAVDAAAENVYELPPDHIKPGMVLDEDVYAASGAFVAPKGMEVDEAVLRLLKRLTDEAADRTIRVRAPRG